MSDIEIHGRDLRIGMGISAWDVEYTAHHIPTGCKVVWQTHGSEPQSQNKMRDRALMALELLTEVYPRTKGIDNQRRTP